MELSQCGNAIKTLARCITCLTRVGNELAIQASPSQLAFHTLNSSQSAYQSITFKPDFFDVYKVSGNQVQCSVLLKAICSLLRTPIASIDNLSVRLPDPDASKVQWALECYSEWLRRRKAVRRYSMKRWKYKKQARGHLVTHE